MFGRMRIDPKQVAADIELARLDDLINGITKTPEINLRGIADKLEKGLEKLPAQEDSRLYVELNNYLGKMQRAVRDHNENVFDNKVGVLQRLNQIRSDYAA